MLSAYYHITYEDYSNLHKYVISCSFFILVPLVYLIFIRSYFSLGRFLIIVLFVVKDAPKEPGTQVGM